MQDGIAAGEYVTLEEPIGAAQNLFVRFDGRVIHGIHQADTPFTLDRALTATWGQGIGAGIMGRRKFGPQTGEWGDTDWRGWWGDEPPIRTPDFVVTHHRRQPIHFANGTSSHFIDGSSAEVLEQARESAKGQAVRLGTGVRLWDGLAGVHERYDLEFVASSNGQVHQFWNREAR